MAWNARLIIWLGQLLKFGLATSKVLNNYVSILVYNRYKLMLR